MSVSPDEEQPRAEEPTELSQASSLDAPEEKVIAMSQEPETETGEPGAGPREAAEAAVFQARARLEDGREEVAGRLERAADQLRERTAGNAGSPVIERVAKSMESTAGYLHEHETAAIAGDVSSYVKLHPTTALVLAAFLGFLLGRLLK